ncbi:HAMP domain-containing histidine kinase [Alicycliphilus denitrificans]|uniref:histidine kinase n=1 Tax=Alicycliphilus denitrificans TaxID=179636 RepID=A0A858ZQ25_9BURK|nr:HAMP domain-containing sensor histidine kinase [Alicycliphilus denitrificans]ADU98497.1 ATP-binding region ATPase domain protein [Alicycliphilus denitrificans BC]QKD42877.1 HAMP domain-containing histidine kinase [Alicycliphilus denitrificans]GAO20533.1 ATP-binding domain-containing protein [Alicycliphilus sp. B1]GAO26491.1 ATP-binding domain-containing protein [Alicycliphilus sp. B1]
MTVQSLSLSQRLSAVFVLLLLACCAASVVLQMRGSERHEQEVIQRLSLDLAPQIARYPELMEPRGFNPSAVSGLFDKLMAVNPSVEVYLLDAGGRIQSYSAPEGAVKRLQVDLAPVRRLLGGGALPIFGDDPRSPDGRKVFSAAPLKAAGRDAGYVYVILQGESRESLAARVNAGSAANAMLWSMTLVALLGLMAGLAAFRLITRPLRTLTEAVRGLETHGMSWLPQARPLLKQAARSGGEIALLGQSFERLAQRTQEQWQALRNQDQQRRELFANLSHDLRTPLTSLHGYLETLRMKSEVLEPQEQRRYLDIALEQSRKVGRLAQEMFELARLEYGVVKPEMEQFFLADLLQDVFQKFELAAEAKHQRLVADIAPGLPPITADLAMMERVLMNLIDNAVRVAPEGGEITVELQPHAQGGIEVTVRDTGPGISAALQEHLFERPAFTGYAAAQGARSGGFGLMIVYRILQLHESTIRLMSQPGAGAVFRFVLR